MAASTPMDLRMGVMGRYRRLANHSAESDHNGTTISIDFDTHI